MTFSHETAGYSLPSLHSMAGHYCSTGTSYGHFISHRVFGAESAMGGHCVGATSLFELVHPATIEVALQAAASTNAFAVRSPNRLCQT